MSLPPFLHGCFDWRVNGYHWASEPDIDLLSNAALGADNPFVVVASVVEHAKRGDHTKATHLVQYFEQHEPFALARVALLVFADIALGRDLSYLELTLQSPDNHVRTYAGEAAGYCSSLALVPAMVRAWKDAEFVHDYEMIGFAITDLLESEPGEMGNNVGIRDERELNIIPRTEAGRRLLERLMEHRRARDEEPAPLEPSPFPGLVMAEYERLRERYGPDAIVWAGDQLDMTRFVRRFLARAKNPARGVGDFIRLRHRFEAWTGERCDDFFHAFAPQRLDMAATLEDFLRTKAAAYEPGRRYFWGHPIPSDT